jgi:flagellar motor protein MotB
VEGQAVLEPLSRRSATLQLLCRAQLKARLNRILPTQDTPRGLVVSVPASLLSNHQALPRETSEKLVRIAEIIPPDVAVRVEGYTDDRGTSARNESGSSGLAETVREVLVANDNVPREIMATGFVSKALARARAKRCVQIVIAGRGIGQSVSLARASQSATHNGGLVRGRHMIAMNAALRASANR